MNCAKPNISPFQNASLQRLEEENQEAAHKLAEVVERGEDLLHRIQEALADIADAQLKKQNSKDDPETSSGDAVVAIKQEPT